MHGYAYFDDASGQHWLSSCPDIEGLGEQLLGFRGADEAGELDPDDGVTESHIYSRWCADTDSIKA